MKKLPLKKLSRKKKQPEAPTRITNETVAEHREQILAGAKKFKYPHQYVRHKVVFNAIIVTTLAVLAAAVAGWHQLYVAQNTSEFMYRLTQVLPVPVANVDGTSVRYSDYLMRYRSQQLWLQTQGFSGINTTESQSQLDFYKRAVLTGLEEDMYAEARADELGVSVTDAEVQSVIDENRNTVNGRISQESYDASTLATLGYTPREYRHILRQSLLRQKVAYAVDTNAKQVSEELQTIIADERRPSLESIAAEYNEDNEASVEFGASGSVPKNNQDGGLSEIALSLEENAISEPRQSTTGDGYYFVQKLSEDDRQVSYQYIRVPLNAFELSMEQLNEQNKIREFIDV